MDISLIDQRINQSNQYYQALYSNLMSGLDAIERMTGNSQDQQQVVEDTAAIERAWNRLMNVYRRNIRAHIEASHE